MKPSVTAPFTVYSEEHVQELIGQVSGHVNLFWGKAVPLSEFVNDVWQSAKREGFIDGYLNAQCGLYVAMHGHGPPASMVFDWVKTAARRAMFEENDDSLKEFE